MQPLFRLLMLAAWLVAAPAGAQTSPLDADDAATIRNVIEAQITAFKADDAAAAFSFASPGIQRLFGNPEAFIAMVRGGYLPVYRPREVEFRELAVLRERWTQRVLIVGPDGVPVMALYPMEKQPDGSWRIDGCVLERSPEQTA